MRIDSLYICPWSLKDPLCESQSLAYIRRLVGAGYSFGLVTLESGRFGLTKEETEAARSRLAAENIHWFPARWSTGNSVKGKIAGIGSVLSVGGRACLNYRPTLIHSRSSLPAFMAVTIAKVFGLKFLYDADSVLSEEYADTGHLSTNSRGFKFLAWSENWARKNAEQMIVLTRTLKQDIEEKFRPASPIEVIPCCVDTEMFRPDDEWRSKRRAELGLGDEKLFVYVGKAGSWYLVEETFRFFRFFKETDPACNLLIITQDDPAVFQKIAADERVPEKDFFVRSAARDEVREWLAAADAGFSLIRQLPSKRGSSPVKFAEYLSSGLPVITTDGIGDCSRVIVENNAGVVLPTTSDQHISEGVDALRELWMQDRSTLVHRCRAAAGGEFDLENVGGERYRRLYAQLLPKVTGDRSLRAERAGF